MKALLLLLAWLPALAWSWWIHDLLCRPQPGLPGGWGWSLYANLGHAFLFGVLALLLLPALVQAGLKGRRCFWLAFLLAGAFALVEELVQAGLATRSGSLLDAVTGALGGAAALQFAWSVVLRGRPGWRAALLLGAACGSALVETLAGSVLF